MSVWMAVAGGALLVAAFYDALSTTLVTTTAAGPLTARIAAVLWSLARRLARGPRSALMGLTGPVILMMTIGVWLLMLWGGWTLIFAAGPDAVVSASTGEAADWWARVYFAAFTTFTLGVGDYIPNGAPWQLLTSLAVISGLVLTTMAITYLVPVVTAVTVRRTQANSIAGLGATPEGIVVAGWRHGSFQFIEDQLPRVAEGIILTAERHLSYPILHFFHSTARHEDFRTQLFNLDEAVTILQHAIPEQVQPHPAALATVRHATTQVMRHVPASAPPAGEPTPTGLERLRQAGIPTVDDETFGQRLEVVSEHRRHLVAFAEESLWHGQHSVPS